MLVNPVQDDEKFDTPRMIETNQGKLAQIPGLPDQWDLEFNNTTETWVAPAPKQLDPIWSVEEGCKRIDALAWCGLSGKPLPQLYQKKDRAVVVSKRTIVGCLMLDARRKPFGIFRFEAMPEKRAGQNRVYVEKKLLFAGIGESGYLPERLKHYNGIMRQARRLLNWDSPEYFFSES